MSHTILLVQPSPKPESRTYSDYESVNDCLEGKLTNRNKKKEKLFKLLKFYN